MVPFLLYLVTGLATGGQVFRLMMWAVWGKAVYSLEVVSFVGSVLLCSAAVFSLGQARWAAWVAFVATIGMWSFYGPVMAVSVPGITKVSHLVYFLPALLLVLTTAYAAMAGPLRERLDRAPAWLFPEAAGRGAKIVAGIVALGVAGAVLASLILVGVENTVTHEMRWMTGEGRNARGEREILLIYGTHPYFYERFYSEDLARYLESLGGETVAVTFQVTADFGKVRGYRIRQVGQWPGRSKGWAGGGSGCGGKLPACDDPVRALSHSPWSQ